ncbi:MAG: hypothetical protein HUN04_15365 [Desulfobacter sp.]|nr:MAG: hypothetical protein HUN04_15365 [Desulfobacter sp.]
MTGITIRLSVLFVYLFLSLSPVSAGQSQCITCHTDLKKLIRLCWEVEKIKPKPPESAENSGEG